MYSMTQRLCHQQPMDSIPVRNPDMHLLLLLRASAFCMYPLPTLLQHAACDPQPKQQSSNTGQPSATSSVAAAATWQESGPVQSRQAGHRAPHSEAAEGWQQLPAE